MLARLEQRMRNEDGVVLVIALLVVAALTISTAAMVTLTQSNERAFGRDKLETRAFNTAEQAFNEGIATLRAYDQGQIRAGSFYASEQTPQSCCGGLGGWWAQKVTPSNWQIWSTGLSPNGDVLRRLSVQTNVDTTTITTQPSLAWSYGFFIANPPSCTNIVGTATLTVSTFVNGDLCLNGTNQIVEPSSSGAQVVELYVKGKLYISGSAQVGTSTRGIRLANIVGGCVRNNQNRICSQAAQSRVWAGNPGPPAYGATQTTLTKPVIDAPSTYAEARWSTPTCTGGSFVFDNDTTRNTSLGTVDIFPGSSYDCTFNDPSGGYVSRIAWNATTKTLTIDGTVYLDGNLSLNGGAKANYTGFGSLYVNGTVNTAGNSTLCGPGATVSGSTCSGLWNANLGALSIVAVNAGNATPAWSMSGNAEYNVFAYVVGKFTETGTSYVTGPVVADSGSVAGTSDHTDAPNPPPGTPGATTTTTTTDWRVVPGSWQQLPNSG